MMSLCQETTSLTSSGSAGAGALLCHGGIKTRLVNAQATLTCHVIGQVYREAVGIVQFKYQRAGNFCAGKTRQLFIQNL